jgi:peroxiredoxin
LPRVKKEYIEQHAKGLEILGVSCDRDAEALTAFLAKNKDMPWPQLFDAKQNPKIEWHPIAREWGINGIPTMFLIDKKGVLRTVTARENMEEMIPKLLAE